jgi:ABC-type transport system involved in multi-copper enzyme maturation permease subunit
MSTQSNSIQNIQRLGHRVLRRFVNPIMIKDFRAQMSGARAFKILTAYLLGLSVLAYAIYRILMAMANARFSYGNPQSAMIGQALFVSLVFLEMAFISFVTPALTAGTISGEIERRTYDMLFATPLRPAAILWGKAVTALSYVLLLIVASIPLSSVIFLFGGVAVRDMIQAVGLFAVVAVTYSIVGVFFSALTRRTAQATVLSYAVVLLMVFGTIFAWAAVQAINQTTGPNQASLALLYLNPFSALVSAVLTAESVNAIMSMGPLMGMMLEISGSMRILGLHYPTPIARPLWQYTVALYGTISVILYLLTTQLVKPVRRWRVGRRAWLAVALITLILAGGLFIVFRPETSGGFDTGRTPTPTPARAFPVLRGINVPPPPPVPTPTPFDAPPPSPTPTPFSPPPN